MQRGANSLDFISRWSVSYKVIVNKNVVQGLVPVQLNSNAHKGLNYNNIEI
jgi:hypothetical protein